MCAEYVGGSLYKLLFWFNIYSNLISFDGIILVAYMLIIFNVLLLLIRYTDMESEDYSFYMGLVFLLENDIQDLGYDLAFSTEVNM